MSDEMATAYRADDAAKNAMDELRRIIEQYLAGDEDHTDRCSHATHEHLRAAAYGLRRDSAHIVAVWD